MSNLGAEAKIGDLALSAVVTRADGTVEDLGVVARTTLDDEAVKTLRKRRRWLGRRDGKADEG